MLASQKWPNLLATRRLFFKSNNKMPPHEGQKSLIQCAPRFLRWFSLAAGVKHGLAYGRAYFGRRTYCESARPVSAFRHGGAGVGLARKRGIGARGTCRKWRDHYRSRLSHRLWVRGDCREIARCGSRYPEATCSSAAELVDAKEKGPWSLDSTILAASVLTMVVGHQFQCGVV